jgi:trehalose 6-phosphate phosphatase
MSDEHPISHPLPPWALGALPEIELVIGARRPAFFLDLDGTLAPIACRPDLVEMPAATREIIDRLARKFLVCITSGRGLEELRHVVRVPSVYYAANHGHEILGPPGSGIILEVGTEYRGAVESVAAEVEKALGSVEGVVIENKGLSLAVHYRLVAVEERPRVERAVKGATARYPALRLLRGRMVFDVLPPQVWDKGRATTWLLEHSGWGPGDVCPVCLGDDLTDEDMFAAVQGWGLSVLVGSPERATRAGYRLHDGQEVARFLEVFATADADL